MATGKYKIRHSVDLPDTPELQTDPEISRSTKQVYDNPSFDSEEITDITDVTDDRAARAVESFVNREKLASEHPYGQHDVYKDALGADAWEAGSGRNVSIDTAKLLTWVIFILAMLLLSAAIIFLAEREIDNNRNVTSTNNDSILKNNSISSRSS